MPILLVEPAPTNLQVRLRRRPVGLPVEADFELIHTTLPRPAAGEVLIRAIWLSIDPYMRGRISMNPRARQTPLGAVMEGRAVGVITESRHSAFEPGEYVWGGSGWQEWSAVPGEQIIRLDPADAPISTALGVLGTPGLTAYLGLKDIGQLRPGEPLVVSAASGAVGAVAGQLGRLAGARVVGIAGGPEKCAYVTSTLGFDACIDRRANGFVEALAASCPKSIDVYFENVGGCVQHSVFQQLNTFGRIVMCGMIAEYNAEILAPGPNLMPIIAKRLRVQGFSVGDGIDRLPEYRSLASAWLHDGKLAYREDISLGLQAAPLALAGLLKGHNFGKALVQVTPDPTRTG